MKKTIILAGLILAASCISQKKTTPPILGDYQGISSDGVRTYISFAENEFEKDVIQTGKSSNFQRIKGKWEAINDSTILLKDSLSKNYYKVSNNEIAEIGSDLANTSATNRKLYRIDYSTEAEGNNESLLKEGVDFFAGGNEPFWSLKVFADSLIEFNQPDLKTPLLFLKSSITVNENYFLINLDSTGLNRAIVYKTPCVNDMSGKVSPYFVELYLKNKHYTGCGDVLDKRLLISGNWKLFKLKTQIVPSDVVANINFDLTKKSVSGKLGCNGFGTSISFSKDMMNYFKIGNIITTLMACKDLAIENEFKSSLQQANNFKLVNNELQLLKNDELLLSFRR